MKKIFLLLLIFVTGNCFSQFQKDPQVKQFLNEFVSNYEKSDNLYFKAYLHPQMIDRIVSSLDYKQSDSAFRDLNDRKTGFVFSPEEKEQISKIWLSQKNKAWDSTLLEHATVFKEKHIPENFTKEQRQEYFKQFEGKHIIQFSAPVFLRDNSLCVFFYATYDGGVLFIMKKENQKWVKHLFKTLFYT